MKAVHFRLLGTGILLGVELCPSGEEPPVAAASTRPDAVLQTQSEKKSAAPGTQTKKQKVANPLNDLLDEAKKEIDGEKFEAAIVPLQKVISEEPDFAYAHFQLAYVYTALKKFAEARTEYERTIAIDPKMSEAYLNLGILLLDEDAKAALAPLGKAVELLPSLARPRFLLGVAEERSGDLAKATENYEGAARLDVSDSEALLHLASLYLRQKRSAEAEAKFAAILELQPSDKAALLGMARSQDAQKKPEAVAAYRKYLVVEPADSAARTRVLQLLLIEGQYDEASAELEKAEAGGPTLDTLKMRAEIQIAAKKWDDAIVTLKQAVAMAPNDAQMHGGLGRIYLQRRDFPSAEKELRMAIQLDGNNIGFWKDLNTTFFLGGNYPAALKVLEQVEKTETPTAGTWFVKAICYDKLNQSKLALEAYEKFLELDQNKNPDQVWQAEQRSKVLKRVLEGRK
jgi:Flp pilus assembly protein TadD